MRRSTWMLFLMAALACAQPGTAPTPVQLQWPDRPLPARILHVRDIYHPADVGLRTTRWQQFVDFVLGPRRPLPGIRHPADIAVSDDGTMLYVSDFALGVVHILNLADGTARYMGRDRKLARPFGLALDSRGNLYVVEQEARQIRVVSPSGETTAIFRSDHLIRPTDIAVDEERGRVYVADPSRQASTEHFVRIFDLEGHYLGELGKGRGMGPAELLFPTYLALDPEGNVYVADTMNSRVSVFDASGNFLRVVGARGDGFGSFDKPKGLGFDSFGNLYVVDSSWSNVQIFGPEDDVLLYFGGRGGYPGLLRNPTALAIAREQNTIFVGDYLNHRIAVYQLVNTQAGDGLQRAQGGKAP